MDDIQTLFDSDEAENEYMKEQEARRLKAEEKKQIEEMAKVMCGYYGTEKCYECRYCCDCHIKQEATRLYNAGYCKQSEGEWVIKWRSTFPQYEPSEYQCSVCGLVRTVKHKYCPNCGSKMKEV